MTTALQVLIEIADYAIEAATWQKKLREKANDVIMNWKDEVLQDSISTMIPALKEENYKNIKEIYGSFKDLIDDSIQDTTKEHSQDEIHHLSDTKTILQNKLKALEN